VIDTLTDDSHGGRIDPETGRRRLSFADEPDGVVARLTRVIDELFESATLPTG
jgi:hypothetical protein